MDHQEARKYAHALVEALKPACERIEIAGSLRRGKATVKDIEILAAPKLTPQRPTFGEPPFKLAIERHLWLLGRASVLSPIKGGDRYKQFWLLSERVNIVKLDLFLALPPSQWGVQMVIRTGPNKPDNNFSQWMVTQRSKGGALPDIAIVRDGAVYDCRNMQVVPMPEEVHFFRFCGMEWIEPWQRRARWGK